MNLPSIRMFLVPMFKVKISSRLSYTELKFAVRNAARLNYLYFEPVDVGIETNVEVNNFGRWLFGVKGFAGHWKNTPADENGWVTVSLPDLQEAKELVGKALEILKTQGVVAEVRWINGDDS